MGAEVALVARARGIRTHLVSRQALEALAQADGLEAFTHGLSRLGAAIDPVHDASSLLDVEQAVRSTARRHLRTLERWQDRRPGLLDVFAAHQDRRSLRALVRGAVQGAPSDARLRALVPTWSLPQGALDALARQPSPAALVAQLTLLAHPDAPRLRALVRQSRPDLGAVDRALLAGFADRASRAAAGDGPTREWIAGLIDTGNAQHAVLIADEPRDVAPADAFVRGGAWLPVEAFSSAATSGAPQRALAIVAASLAKTPLAALLPATPADMTALDRRFLQAALARLEHLGRIDPLSSAPLLRLLLLIEAQSRDLRWLAWGAAWHMPVSERRQQLVTPL